MISTPICDFVKSYTKKNTVRFHMPGHKGKSMLGLESKDITEIDGAGNLYERGGIIAESEKNAGELFGCNTFYSTEGSSLCIRAMLYMVYTSHLSSESKPTIIASRNAHKTFINTAALLDFDIIWLYPKKGDSYHSCSVCGEDVESVLKSFNKKPCAVYLTSPDYLGNTLPIGDIAKVCHKNNIPLLVDNAHGAYMKFLPQSLHPIDLGADMCCDSAHKTLGVLTGGAYLHISKNAPESFVSGAKAALSLFGTTSPSYLILQSLDMANVYLKNYKEKLSDFTIHINNFRQSLIDYGYTLIGDEPLKITICAKKFGYTGEQIAKILCENNIICEFYDPDYVVLMLNEHNSNAEIEFAKKVLLSIEKREPIPNSMPEYKIPKQILTPRQACLSESEILMANECEGRICSGVSVSCPPAVPIVMCGEQIDRDILNMFGYYNIKSCSVVKKQINCI